MLKEDVGGKVGNISILFNKVACSSSPELEIVGIFKTLSRSYRITNYSSRFSEFQGKI
jgi:hypothetical protein